MSPRNRAGLTYTEWEDAAGPGCPRDPTEARRAWRLCEDPSELRSVAEIEAMRRAEKSQDSWIAVLIVTLLGIGLVLIALLSTPK